MFFLRKQFAASPIMARVLPFAVFVVLTVLQEKFGEPARYWLYLLKTVVGAWLIMQMRGAVVEMRWKISLEAVLVGIAVFALWVGLDPFYPHLSSEGLMWNPHSEFGDNSGLAWFFIVVRIVGMTFVVPPIEEVFYRSFLYRFIAQKDFLSLPLSAFRLWPFLGVSFFFGAHHQWLAGILAGAAYQWLTIKKGRLGDSMTAHAITNLLLGLWVIWKSAWNFF